MKLSEYKSYDDLPLFLNVATVAKVLGIAPSSSYELMHEADFPVLKIGNRLLVPKEQFVAWVEQHTKAVTAVEQAAKLRSLEKHLSVSQ